MNDFLNTVLTFPTLPWSVLLCFCVVYWLLAATGLVDMDHGADGWMDPDIGDLVDSGHHAGNHHGPDGSAGMLSRLGLAGIPLMIVLSVLVFVGWLITYYVHLWALSDLSNTGRWLIGAGTCVVALVFATMAAGFILRPVRRLMLRLKPPAGPTSILGRSGTVLSPVVDEHQGRAEFPDGGAGLHLQVRAQAGKSYPRGANVVLLTLDEEQDAYIVISQEDFDSQ